MPRRGQRHASGAKGTNGSIARGSRYGLAKRRELAADLERMRAALYSVGPAELDALRTSGTLSDSTAFCADVAAAEILRLRRAVEGEPAPGDEHPPRPLSAQRVARLGRAQRLLTLALACQARALTADDREAAATAGALLAKADALLVDTLKLDTEAEVPSLASYLAARREAPATDAQRANGSEPELEPAEPFESSFHTQERES